MCDASQSQSGLRQVRKKSTRYLSIEDPRSLFLHTLEEQTEAYLSTDIQTNPQHYGQNEILANRARGPIHMKANDGKMDLLRTKLDYFLIVRQTT